MYLMSSLQRYSVSLQPRGYPVASLMYSSMGSAMFYQKVLVTPAHIRATRRMLRYPSFTITPRYS